MQRRQAEKQRNLDLQLQVTLQHENPRSSSPPPAQQCGGDDHLSDLGTPQTVAKKENDRRGSIRDLSLVRSSSAEFAQGQGKPKLSSIRRTSISTEDKVQGLVVDPLQLFAGISEVKAAKQLKNLSLSFSVKKQTPDQEVEDGVQVNWKSFRNKDKRQTYDQEVEHGVQFNSKSFKKRVQDGVEFDLSKTLHLRGKGLADQTRVELQEKGWKDRSLDILGMIQDPETVLNLSRNFRAVGVEDQSGNLSPTVKSLNVKRPTAKNLYVVHGMAEDGSQCAGFWTSEQLLTDVDKATQKTLDQMLDQIPHDEGQNFFDKYNSPNTTGDSPNLPAAPNLIVAPNLPVAPGRVRQLTHRKKTGWAADTQEKNIEPHPRRLGSQMSSNEEQHSQGVRSIRRASIFNHPSTPLPINGQSSAKTSIGSPLPRSTLITFMPPMNQRRPSSTLPTVIGQIRVTSAERSIESINSIHSPTAAIKAWKSENSSDI